jgi:hypothetical protein
VQDPIQEIQLKRAGGMAQVLEYLPSKGEALSSNPSTKKKKKVLVGKSVVGILDTA